MLKLYLKKLYYLFKPTPFPKNTTANFAYIFHTERIYDANLFSRLLRFCQNYHRLTGKRAICTLMTGVNAEVLQGCQEHGVSEEEYVRRARQLSEVATLGYHGHFWIDPTRINDPQSPMKREAFFEEAFRKQFEADLDWFQKNGIQHHGLYAAGWWFMNEVILSALVDSNFRADFSFSYSPYFRNPFSFALMMNEKLPPGESFVVHFKQKSMLCIQNFIGCHTTPLIQDFNRNFLKLIGQTKSVTGVLNTHDYDLDEVNTLRCIEYLKSQPQVQFLDADEIIHLAKSISTREIFFGNEK